eukprot:maker-scaffold745_size103310-snap-gene-0.18 protein:Tk02586 transcript:maker-scaffold745_size103310-snap-gene-0.18-mRNA-1 annotation:"hypothetical protein"
MDKMELLVLFLGLLLVQVRSEEDFCHEAGFCQDSYFASMDTEDYNECLAECKMEPECRFFSHDPSRSPNCYFMQECQFPTSDCSNCFSGSERCRFYEGGDPGPGSTQLACGFNGECQGDIISSPTGIEHPDSCSEACVQESLCQWSSYNWNAGTCDLLKDCERWDANFEARTVSSHRYCTPDRFDGLMLVPAWNGVYTNVCDPFQSTNECTIQGEDLLLMGGGIFGGWVGGQIVACDELGTCSTFSTLNQTWKILVQELDLHPWESALKLSPTELWILPGDRDVTQRLDMSTLEVADYVTLPHNVSLPCVVALNETHFLYAGGRDFELDSAIEDAYIFDQSQETWSAASSMREARFEHHCVAFTKDDGTVAKVLALGGSNSNAHTWIYEVELDVWRSGPTLPRSLSGATHFSSAWVSGSLVIVPRTYNPAPLFTFDPATELFELLPRELSVDMPNKASIILSVPKFTIPCQ